MPPNPSIEAVVADGARLHTRSSCGRGPYASCVREGQTARAASRSGMTSGRARGRGALMGWIRPVGHVAGRVAARGAAGDRA
jgi:hypothetical protein